MQAKSDDELRALTAAFKERVAGGEDLDAILPEAFAAVREASVRTMGLRHFDVQLIGGMALNDGQIAEMKTGEGKTLVSTLAGYLNALSGNNVHIVTVNDYLAQPRQRVDGPDLPLPGHGRGPHPERHDSPTAKIPAYAADVTYGTNTEFGFDYLRDNMVTRAELARAARPRTSPSWTRWTPSSSTRRAPRSSSRAPARRPPRRTTSSPRSHAASAPRTRTTTWTRPRSTIDATESGLEKIEAMLGIDDIYADPSGQLANHLQQALKAPVPVPPRRGLRRRERRGQDRRRVHGPHHGGPPLLRGPAPGHRGQGARARARGEPDARHHHAAELLPPVRQALGHDRHGHDRGRRVPRDLQAAGRRHPAEPPGDPQGRWTTSSTARWTPSSTPWPTTWPSAMPRDSLAWSAPCPSKAPSASPRLLDKRGIKHETLNAKNHEREAHIVAQAGRVGRRDHRHEHGRPRHRHPAWRQPRGHGRRPAARARVRPDRRLSDEAASPDAAEADEERARHPRTRMRLCPGRGQAGVRRRARRRDRSRRPHRHRHRAPRVATHRQPAARPFRPPGRPGHHPVLPVARGRPHEAFRRRPHGLHRPHDGEDRHARGHAHPGRHGLQGHREARSARWRACTSPPARTCWNTTTS